MRIITVLALSLILYGAAQRSGMAQTQVDVHACTKQGNDYDCDRHSFDGALAVAKTVSIQVPRRDPNSLKQLQRLVASLGKTVQPDSADLTLVLTDPQPEGVYFGPSDRKLATISVYYNAPSSGQSGQGQLIWQESYKGQPDTPWHTAAYDVIEQFRKDIKHP